jgi:hypothetical protein
MVEPTNYVSVVDCAIIRKKVRLEGDDEPAPARHGEFPTEDLIAIAIEDGSPLVEKDVFRLANSCDISIGDVLLSPSSLETNASP